MEIHRAEQFNNALLHSLRTIQAAKTQLHLFTASSPTPTVLVSQIRLCDVLLGEIEAISCSLERRMRYRRVIRRCSVVARCGRDSRRLPVVQGDPANRPRETR